MPQPLSTTMITQERLLVALSMSTAFGTVAAVIYLVSFWLTFGIDVFQFIGLSDIIKLAIFPILVGGSSLFGGYVIGTVINVARRSRDEANPEPTAVEAPSEQISEALSESP